jgi:hypothetical protein
MRQRIIFALIVRSSRLRARKAQGQTVAIVNNEEITAGDLNSELTSASNLAGADTKQARVAVLQKLINRKLLVQQAKSDGLDSRLNS